MLHCNVFLCIMFLKGVAMEKEEWFTFTQASKLAHKNRNYFFNRYKNSPSYFDPETVKVVCGIKIISKSGIEYVIKKIKKMVAHLNKSVSRWLTS